MEKKKKIRVDRLRKLANHLLKGKLGHARFDFSTFNFNRTYKFGNEEIKNKCGTNGCALGECPIVWPKEWRFEGNDVNLIKDSVLPEGYYIKCGLLAAAKFFNITEEMSEHLFMPSDYDFDEESWIEKLQKPILYGGVILGERATKEEVANNIFLFCDKVEKGEITL